MERPKTKPELKEFKLRRTTHTYEYCYVMATDWEDAEEQGNYQTQEWEQEDSRSEIDVEECE
jgi:hypothetical protein